MPTDNDPAKGNKGATKVITEADVNVLTEWKSTSGSPDMGPDKLREFVRHLSEDYEHDYGTICHAAAAAGHAAIRAINNGPSGGMTGFQMGFVFWSLASRLGIVEEGEPARLVKYGNMLYPQYAAEFSNHVPRSVMSWLRKEAERLLAESGTGDDLSAPGGAHPDVVEHWRSLAAGHPPYGLPLEPEHDD